MVQSNINIHLVAPPHGGAARRATVISGMHVMRLEHASPFSISSAKKSKCRRPMSLVRDQRHVGKRRANPALRAPAARRLMQQSCIGRLVGDRGVNTGVGSLCTRKVVICSPTEERSSSKVGSLKDRATNQHNQIEWRSLTRAISPLL